MVASGGAGGGNGAGGGPFIDSSRLDLRRYARRTPLAMVLADYLVYVERNPRKVNRTRRRSTTAPGTVHPVPSLSRYIHTPSTMPPPACYLPPGSKELFGGNNCY